jgi:hypothetical protein
MVGTSPKTGGGAGPAVSDGGEAKILGFEWLGAADLGGAVGSGPGTTAADLGGLGDGGGGGGVVEGRRMGGGRRESGRSQLATSAYASVWRVLVTPL